MGWVERMVDLVDDPQFGGNSIIAKSKTFEETLDRLVAEDVNMALLGSKALLDNNRTVEDTKVVALNLNLNLMDRVPSRLLEIGWK